MVIIKTFIDKRSYYALHDALCDFVRNNTQSSSSVRLYCKLETIFESLAWAKLSIRLNKQGLRVLQGEGELI